MICAQRQTVSNRDQFREILNKLHLDERKRERRGLLSTAQLTLEFRPPLQLPANLILMRLLAERSNSVDNKLLMADLVIMDSQGPSSVVEHCVTLVRFLEISGA